MKKVKSLEDLKVKTFEKKEVVKDEELTKTEAPSFRHTGTSPMRKEHPILADLHMDLNTALASEVTKGGLSRDLKRLCEIEIQSIRQKIAKYKLENNISELDYKRWYS